MKNKKLIKYLKIIVCLLIIIAAVLFGSLLFRKAKNNIDNKLIGSWTTDGITIYNFNKDGTGELKVSLGEYKFDYRIEEDKIIIDFANEESEDTTYTYSFKKENLILKSDNGTFVFKKNK